MGSPSAPKPTKAQLEAEQLQLEQLRKQQEKAARTEKEAKALTKARRGGASSLLQGTETGVSSGYSSLLGGK